MVNFQGKKPLFLTTKRKNAIFFFKSENVPRLTTKCNEAGNEIVRDLLTLRHPCITIPHGNVQHWSDIPHQQHTNSRYTTLHPHSLLFLTRNATHTTSHVQFNFLLKQIQNCLSVGYVYPNWNVWAYRLNTYERLVQRVSRRWINLIHTVLQVTERSLCFVLLSSPKILTKKIFYQLSFSSHVISFSCPFNFVQTTN